MELVAHAHFRAVCRCQIFTDRQIVFCVAFDLDVLFHRVGYDHDQAFFLVAVIYFDRNFLPLFIRQLELLGVGFAGSLILREHFRVKVDLHTQVFHGNIFRIVFRSGFFYFEVCTFLRICCFFRCETGRC